MLDAILAAGFEALLTMSGAVIVRPEVTIGYRECVAHDTAYYMGQWSAWADCTLDIVLPTEQWNGGGTARIVLGEDVYEGCNVLWYEDIRASGLWWLKAECP